jgi:hypothetical protein
VNSGMSAVRIASASGTFTGPTLAVTLTGPTLAVVEHTWHKSKMSRDRHGWQDIAISEAACKKRMRLFFFDFSTTF